jgi:hypothetical protein
LDGAGGFDQFPAVFCVSDFRLENYDFVCCDLLHFTDDKNLTMLIHVLVDAFCSVRLSDDDGDTLALIWWQYE